MDTTSPSLFRRLCEPGTRQLAQSEFIQIYTPLIAFWARRFGVSAPQLEDFLQEVLTHLLENLSRFDPKRGRFRPWLRRVVENRVRDHFRQHRESLADESMIDALADNANQADEVEREEYLRHVTQRVLRFLQGSFPELIWRAFWMTIVESRRPAEVACELGLEPEQVYRATYQVKSQLRAEFAEFLD